MSKLSDYAQLVKLRLSLTVVFSSSVAYLIAIRGQSLDTMAIVWVSLGGFLVTAAANATNELIEQPYDALMTRTRNRPLPAGRMARWEAAVFIVTTLLAGFLILSLNFNWLTGLIALVSYSLYSFLYTPLKRVTALSVAVGAIPGALPPAIGVVAAAGEFTQLAWVLFAIQFVWQFPHFWAIAWLGADEYAKAGFRLLPGDGKAGSWLAINIVLSCLLLFPSVWLLLVCGISSSAAFWVGIGATIVFLIPCLMLLTTRDRRSALLVMFASFLFLPTVWIAIWLL
jgi:protoheme IX farnesyltransferase